MLSRVKTSGTLKATKETFMKWLSFFRLPKREVDYIREGICPTCKTGRLLEGPHGGASINIACENSQCHSEFNVCDDMGIGIVDKLGSLNDESRKWRKNLYGIQNANPSS
jgi:hypothetical protein